MDFLETQWKNLKIKIRQFGPRNQIVELFEIECCQHCRKLKEDLDSDDKIELRLKPHFVYNTVQSNFVHFQQ